MALIRRTIDNPHRVAQRQASEVMDRLAADLIALYTRRGGDHLRRIGGSLTADALDSLIGRTSTTDKEA